MRDTTFRITIVFLMLLSTVTRAEDENYLEQHIQIGLKQNLQISQQKFEEEKCYQDIKSAWASLSYLLSI